MFLRRKECLLNSQTNRISKRYELVTHLLIWSIHDSVFTDHSSIKTGWNRVVPLVPIRTLVIDWQDLLFIRNMHDLTLSFLSHYKISRVSIEENELFQTVSNTNYIKNLSFGGVCSFDQVEIFVLLFPRMQQLRIHSQKKEEIEFILRFLLNSHLVLWRWKSLAWMEIKSSRNNYFYGDKKQINKTSFVFLLSIVRVLSYSLTISRVFFRSDNISVNGPLSRFQLVLYKFIISDLKLPLMCHFVGRTSFVL